jgi:hypothetical protein
VLDKDEQEISQIIEDSLAEILSGRASLEDVLERHPTLVAVLRPELESALWLISQREQVRARPGFVSASRKRLVSKIKQEASNRGAKRALFGFNWPVRRPAFQWVAAILIFIILFSTTGGVVSAAQGSVPGEDLYPVKRASEQVRFDLTSNAVQRAQLSSDFAARRLDEVEVLIARNQDQYVDQTLRDYQQQVRKTIALLDTVRDDKALEKYQLAMTLEQDFSRQEDKLNALMLTAPLALRVEILSARDASVMGALLTTVVSDKIKEANPQFTFTPSPTSTSSSTVTSTSTSTDPATSTDPVTDPATSTNTKEPPFTNTATPVIVVVTPVPADSDADQKETQIDTTKKDPVLPSATPTPDRPSIKPGLTKTLLPVPTKEERPPKEIKPPKDTKEPKDD